MSNRSNAILEAANQAINVRDFACSKSREREVILETLMENGVIPNADVVEEVEKEVNNIWRQSQLDAGVNPKHYV